MPHRGQGDGSDRERDRVGSPFASYIGRRVAPIEGSADTGRSVAVKLIQVVVWTVAASIGFGVGLVIAAFLGIAWLSCQLPSVPPLCAKVDNTLRVDGAWHSGRTHLQARPEGESWCEVEAKKLEDDRLHVLIRTRWSDFRHDMDLRITFREDDTPQVAVEGTTYEVATTTSWRDGPAGGTLRLSSNALPSGDGPELVIAYDLEIERGGSPVQTTGKVALRAEDIK